MKEKLLNILLVVFSLVGYLEWGKDNKMFLFQAEAEVISKLFVDPIAALHPLTVLPLLGQLLLILTLFQKKSSKTLTYVGLICIGLLLAFMFVIGCISLNIKIILSTLPFIICGVFTLQHYRKAKRNN